MLLISAAAYLLSPANISPLLCLSYHPVILLSYHPIILSFTPLQYGGELPKELPKKGERWSAIEAVPFAAAQQWGGMGDTLMTTEKVSLAFSILKKSCLKVRPFSRLRSRSRELVVICSNTSFSVFIYLSELSER